MPSLEGAARAVARGISAVWLLCLLELLVLAALPQGGFASVWELQWGTFWLAPTVLGAGTVLGIAGAALAASLAAANRPLPRIGVAVAAALFGIIVGWGIGGGRHLEAPLARWGFALAVGSGGAVVAFLFGPWIALGVRRRPGLMAALSLGAILLVTLANRFVLVRLYPAFHLGLAGLALLGAPFAREAVARITERSSTSLASAVPVSGPHLHADRRPAARWLSRWGWVALTATLSGTAFGVAPSAARVLGGFDNFRMVLLEEGPVLGQAVRLAAWLAPPPPIDPEAASCANGMPCEVNPAPSNGTRHLDLRGRDLMLVTIDAVRADHVGAYGYQRRTTPALDAIATNGVLFEHAYCPTPHTSYSVTSLMTGKYMRPLLLQGAGEDSDTWAALLRSYGYRTAGFFPPALFFIDAQRFQGFRKRLLDFEYYKFEFAEGQTRARQVREYLAQTPRDRPLFVWVHLFAPHEPYEAHPEHHFGDRDVDRYDSEIAFADATLEEMERAFRERSPKGIVIVSADHGEEFGDHGGHYHGTTVYDEQVRVPLVISAPGLLEPRRVSEVVQTIDLLPTILAALEIPRPPRIRGRDLGPLLLGARPEEPGLALAETEGQSLLAEGPFRLICARQVGACQLFDITADRLQSRDVSSAQSERAHTMRTRLRALGASHGTFEVTGLRAEGRGWPGAILRGISGEGDAAEEIAALLEDADREIRRKAGEVLFSLRRPETAASLRLALSRDEDLVVRRWCALALTRMGQGAPLVSELLEDPDLAWRRLAALALAEAGDRRGEGLLVAWWRDSSSRDYQRSRELLSAFSTLRSKDAVWSLANSLDDVRLRPYLAETLAAIGDEAARIPLCRALAEERYQSARVALTRALVRLGAEGELAAPLVRFLGVPDPIPGGIEAGLATGILEHLGGPNEKDLARLTRDARLGVAILVVVPRGGNGTGARVLVRAKNPGSTPANVHVGARADPLELDAEGKPKKTRKLPVLDRSRAATLVVPPSPDPVEVHALLPATLGAAPGRALWLVVYSEGDIEVSALAVVPLSDELPPPLPQPWVPEVPPQ